MDGRELRRCVTQLDMTSHRNQVRRRAEAAAKRDAIGTALAGNITGLAPTAAGGKPRSPLVIYRPPGQRVGEDGGGKQLNVHAKEFIMSPPQPHRRHPLQTSRSAGSLMAEEQRRGGLATQENSSTEDGERGTVVMSPAGGVASGVGTPVSGPILQHQHSILLPSSIRHSPSSKNVRWEDGRRGGGGGGLVRSKSMVSPGRGRQSEAEPHTSARDSVVTPLGPLSRSQYANIKHAIEGTGKLNSEDTMGVVKVLIDRAIESRNYANVIATACEKIIDREASEETGQGGSSVFLESLINYSQYSLNKLKESSVNRRFNGIMALVCELYIMLKSKWSVRDVRWGLVSPSQWLLKLLAKCCHEVLQDPHLHVKPDQVESLFLTMTMVGRDVERELPQNMDSLMCCVRDSFLSNPRLSPGIKHTLLQIIEIHAASWQLPAFTLMYYKGSSHAGLA